MPTLSRDRSLLQYIDLASVDQIRYKTEMDEGGYWDKVRS